MASATSSPFKKDHIRKNLAYYFDDERIAIVERNGTGDSSGEWKSIQSATEAADGDRLRLHYHARYTPVTGLEQDLNTVIGVKYGLHLALIDYIRARLHEDAGDMQRSSYFYAKFKERVQKYPYRKSGQRGIQLFGLR